MSKLETTVIGEEGMPTYTASDGSEWDLFCGSGENVEEVLSLIKNSSFVLPESTPIPKIAIP